MIHAEQLSRPALRRLLRERRRALSPAAQRQAARQLYRQLAQHPLFRRARHIALYLPNDGEIDPALLRREALRRGKQVYLPLLARWPRTRMRFQRIEAGETLQRNRFRIAEPRPQAHRQRQPWTLDLLLLPLVGFDAHGGRLGMGGGFYDRALAYRLRHPNWQKPRLIGLAHSCQQVERLPLESWDVPLHATLTERGWFDACSATLAGDA